MQRTGETHTRVQQRSHITYLAVPDSLLDSWFPISRASLDGLDPDPDCRPRTTAPRFFAPPWDEEFAPREPCLLRRRFLLVSAS